MTKMLLRYFLLLFGLFFLGHFILTMCYRFGDIPTIAIGVLALVAAVFTFYKSAKPKGSKKEVLYGILSGFFIWTFGEFLAAREIIEIADSQFFPLLAVYICAVSFLLYRRSGKTIHPIKRWTKKLMANAPTGNKITKLPLLGGSGEAYFTSATSCSAVVLMETPNRKVC